MAVCFYLVNRSEAENRYLAWDFIRPRILRRSNHCLLDWSHNSRSAFALLPCNARQTTPDPGKDKLRVLQHPLANNTVLRMDTDRRFDRESTYGAIPRCATILHYYSDFAYPSTIFRGANATGLGSKVRQRFQTPGVCRRGYAQLRSDRASGAPWIQRTCQVMTTTRKLATLIFSSAGAFGVSNSQHPSQHSPIAKDVPTAAERPRQKNLKERIPKYYCS